MKFIIIAALTMLTISGCRTTDPPRTLFTQNAEQGYALGTIDWKSGDSTRV
jgi:hypothetical protein